MPSNINFFTLEILKGTATCMIAIEVAHGMASIVLFSKVQQQTCEQQG
jgi:hypothetical protein